MKTDLEFLAGRLRFLVRWRENDRDAYARAVAEHQRTRAIPAGRSGYERSMKMRATYQLKRAEKKLALLLREDFQT